MIAARAFKKLVHPFGKFVEASRATVLNVWPELVIFVKEHIVQLAHIDHFTALPAPVDVPFFRLA